MPHKSSGQVPSMLRKVSLEDLLIAKIHTSV
jgi:hypothetical protein